MLRLGVNKGKMKVYRTIGLIGVAFLFIIFLLGSIHYRTPYPLIWFFILAIAGWLIMKTLFRKEKQLIREKKEDKILAWNIYVKLLLFLLVAYPFFSIPRYLAGTPLKTLFAGYIAFIAWFGTLGILGKILGLFKPEYMVKFPTHDLIFILKFILSILVSIGAFFLVFTVLRTFG